MIISKDNSIQEILDSDPDAINILRKHGIDVEENGLYSVRNLALKNCPELVEADSLDYLIEQLNGSISAVLLNRTVGQLVADQPLRARVFDEAGIDFCCGGKRNLASVCEERNLDPEEIIAKLHECDSQADGSADSVKDLSLTELVDHIEATHHKYLEEELPRLEKLSRKVADVHGERVPQLVELAAVFGRLKEEIEQHTMKEEMVLFPYIKQLDSQQPGAPPPFGTVANPIRCMEAEHDDAGQALFKMRELTDEFTAPPDACASWKALVAGLSHLDVDLRTHIHKESSILFPRALKREEQGLV